MRFKGEEGQAMILVALAMSIFLLGAVGLAVDGAHLYSQRQMAQGAADAAAQAGIMSIFDGTNSAGTAQFDATQGSSFTCSTTNSTPCSYASKNGFDSATGDTVTVDFPPASAAPGVNLAPSNPNPDPSKPDSASLIRVTVSRTVNTTLMRMLGPTVSTVKATAMAAIVTVQSPTPILVTDPTNSGTLSMNGNTSITICGGPTRSIQVNSSSPTAYQGGGTIDLTHAGLNNPTGDCATLAGADFGVTGGKYTNPGVQLGTGQYLSKVSPIDDPLADVPAPTLPTSPPPDFEKTTSISKGTDGCTVTGGCTEYWPGRWSRLVPGNHNVIFRPGLYYVQGGGVDLKQTVGGGVNFNAMCTNVTCTDPDTGTGMVIYDTVPAGTAPYPGNTNRPTKGFNIGTMAQLTLQGPTNTVKNNRNEDVPGPPYYGVLFWEDRTANANSHTIGQGNGCFSLIGTIYITNTKAIMQNTSDPNYPNHVQSITYNGTPCSATINQGYIIAGQLSLVGKSAITMKLLPYGYLQVRRVAMVN
jgi:Flp pilus assembly protein TadG